MDKTFLLYLAGPITGMSHKQVIDWRDRVSGNLPAHIHAICPMRSKPYLAGKNEIADSYEDLPLSSSKGILCFARTDVQRCDMILANFSGAERVSIGTVMEIAWAHLLRKPIVVVLDKHHDHAMIRSAADFIVNDLDEAVRIAVSVLTPR